MKNLKNLAIILTVIFFTSCKTSPLIGTWFCDQNKPFTYLTFGEKQGYMSSELVNGNTSNFNYFETDSTLTLKADFGEKQMMYTIEYSIVKVTADSLVLNFGNETLTYIKL